MQGVQNKICDKDQGFSVLEAMIAMALLAAAILPLLSLQGQFIRSVDSIERADRRLEIRHLALNKIKTINIADSPSGDYIQSDFRIAWSSKAVFPLQTVYEAGTPGPNEIALFDVKVEIFFADGAVDSFNIRRLGWKLKDDVQSLLQ